MNDEVGSDFAASLWGGPSFLRSFLKVAIRCNYTQLPSRLLLTLFPHRNPNARLNMFEPFDKRCSSALEKNGRQVTIVVKGSWAVEHVLEA